MQWNKLILLVHEDFQVKCQFIVPAKSNNFDGSYYQYSLTLTSKQMG